MIMISLTGRHPLLLALEVSCLQRVVRRITHGTLCSRIQLKKVESSERAEESAEATPQKDQAWPLVVCHES